MKLFVSRPNYIRQVITVSANIQTISHDFFNTLAMKDRLEIDLGLFRSLAGQVIS